MKEVVFTEQVLLLFNESVQQLVEQNYFGDEDYAVTISPELAQQIRRAREEYSRGETIRCETPEDMQKYFDSL